MCVCVWREREEACVRRLVASDSMYGYVCSYLLLANVQCTAMVHVGGGGVANVPCLRVRAGVPYNMSE